MANRKQQALPSESTDLDNVDLGGVLERVQAVETALEQARVSREKSMAQLREELGRVKDRFQQLYDKQNSLGSEWETFRRDQAERARIVEVHIEDQGASQRAALKRLGKLEETVRHWRPVESVMAPIRKQLGELKVNSERIEESGKRALSQLRDQLREWVPEFRREGKVSSTDTSGLIDPHPARRRK